jgi:AAHS family 4-hydroxybenzoate transporter-like MFS transporter
LTEGAREKPQVIDISQLLEKPSNSFVANLLGWTFFVMLLDGYDFAAIAFAAPDLIREWHVDASLFGMVFSAGIFGIMLGSILFGYLGDKLGRRKSLFFSCVWFGLLTLATSLATSLNGLLWLRFIAGVGIGGAVPLAIVLVSEYAPKGSKVKWVTIMFTGYSIGGAVGGLLASWLLPHFGWKSIFVVGGILPLIAGIAAITRIPESIRFLSLQKGSHTQIANIAVAVQPDLTVAGDAQFVMQDEKQAGKQQSGPFKWKMLFAGVLGIATPLLWLFYIINSLAVFFLQSWFPVLFVATGLSAAQAAFTTALYSVGGTVGGLFVGWLLDKYGMTAGTWLPVLGVVFVAALGHTSGMTLSAVVFCIGFFVMGTQFILTACTPLFYPTAFRSKADGAAIAIAKIGSISGPLIGGILIGMQMPVTTLFYVVAAPVAVGAVFCFFLGRLYHKHYTAAVAATVHS